MISTKLSMPLLMWLMNNIFLETWQQWLCCFDLCHFKTLWSDYSSKYWRFTLACCFAMWKSIARNKRPQTERFCWKSTHRKSWTYCWRMFRSQRRKEIQSLACRWRVFCRFYFYRFIVKLLFIFILSFSCMCMIFLPLYYCYLMYLKKELRVRGRLEMRITKISFCLPKNRRCVVYQIFTHCKSMKYILFYFSAIYSLCYCFIRLFCRCLIV